MATVSFARLQSEVLSLYEPPLRARATYRQVCQVLAEFAALPLTRVSDLKPPAIARWIQAHPERSPARTASLLRTLRPACTYAVAMGYLARSPFDFRPVSGWVRVDVLAPDRPAPQRHLRRDQVAALLALLDREASEGSWKAGRLQALVYLLAFTGLRKGEALHLRPWDVSLESCTVTI